jgi:shikimate kinase
MNIYLIGYRGCGKSTVASRLAKRLHWQACDTDQQIEIIAGRSIADIFAEEGEAVFRQLETSVINEISRDSNKVVSLGGGAPMVEANRQTIAASGRTVWLTASPEELWRRISSDPATASTRPRLTNLHGLDEIRNLLRHRTDVYAACADYTIDTQGLTPDQIVDDIANWWDPVDK